MQKCFLYQNIPIFSDFEPVIDIFEPVECRIAIMPEAFAWHMRQDAPLLITVYNTIALLPGIYYLTAQV